MSNKKTAAPEHPGIFLKREYLDNSVRGNVMLAEELGMTRKQVSEISKGLATVTPVMALRFEKRLGIDAEILVIMQARYDLHVARKKTDLSNVTSLTQAKKNAPEPSMRVNSKAPFAGEKNLTNFQRQMIATSDSALWIAKKGKKVPDLEDFVTGCYNMPAARYYIRHHTGKHAGKKTEAYSIFDRRKNKWVSDEEIIALRAKYKAPPKKRKSNS